MKTPVPGYSFSKYLSFVFILQIICLPSAGQNDSSDSHKAFEEFKKIGSGELDSILRPSEFIVSDSLVTNSYHNSLIAYYTFKRDEFYQANRVFHWQLIASKIIFFVVIALVFSGVWFAGVQFYHGLKKGEKLEAQELEFSMKGIRLNSSVVGLIILTLSIVFFYLYLVHVYPIQKI